MKRLEAITWLAVVLCSFLLYNIFFLDNAQHEDKVEKSFVTNVIDGDTIVISGGERVRLLGIDAPEKGEFFYQESKERLEELIENKEIVLEREGDNKDKYDRLLRYIFLDSRNINLLLVEEGHAICYFYEESRYQSACKGLEETAMQNKIGRWQNQT